MKARSYRSFIISTALALFMPIAARADTGISTFKFSDPSKPGTLKVRIVHGDVRIKGADTNEVSVRTDADAVKSGPRKDGMRVLSVSSGFSLAEKDNVASLEHGFDGTHGGADFTITVPRNTSVIISSAANSDILVSDLTGDVEVKAAHGDIKLNDLAGGALVEITHGDVDASFKSLLANKPLSFVVVHGDVDLAIPANAKANLKLRTQNGTILTDFDEKALVTSVEVVQSGKPRAPEAPAAPNSPAAPRAPRTGDREIGEAVREAVSEGADAVRSATAAANEAISKKIEEIKRKRGGIPTITGGKMISGVLNGGGPEISVTTVHADVTLRKAK